MHPKALKTFNRIVRLDRLDCAPDMVHDSSVIDIRLVCGDAEWGGGAMRVSGFRGGDQCL